MFKFEKLLSNRPKIMQIYIQDNPVQLGVEAGSKVAKIIRSAIKEKGESTIILATGSSQFETLKQLVKEQEIAWNKVTMFHLDEYIGLPESSPASFRRYLKERFLEKVSSLKAYHLINGEADPEEECSRLGNLIKNFSIDVALVGIGENGHLAFNDPPADFETKKPYLMVNLDRDCRQQQLSEGWFKTLDEVPHQAISMSIQQILKSEYIVCSVPDKRKAKAIKNCISHPVSNLFPAGILQNHPNCICFLDKESASLLNEE